LQQLFFIPILFLSVIIHECAHGLAAYRCGDPTAKLAGRITLNPLPHIDLFGTILLPAFLILTRSHFLFGWAKPVPVNPHYFRNLRRDSVFVSAAGPLSNIGLAFAFSFLVILLGLILRVVNLPQSVQTPLLDLFLNGIYINIILAVFNLIPIPPLDGSHILSNLLPLRWSIAYEKLRGLGFILIIIIIATPAIRIIFLPVRFLWGLFQKIITLFL